MSEQKGTYTDLLRVGVGIALALVGVVGTGVGILAVVDPVGTKMADDSDPFGTPPAFAESAGITLLFLFVAGLGVCLAARRRGTSE